MAEIEARNGDDDRDSADGDDLGNRRVSQWHIESVCKICVSLCAVKMRKRWRIGRLSLSKNSALLSWLDQSALSFITNTYKWGFEKLIRYQNTLLRLLSCILHTYAAVILPRSRSFYAFDPRSLSSLPAIYAAMIKAWCLGKNNLVRKREGERLKSHIWDIARIFPTEVSKVINVYQQRHLFVHLYK
jgi:hypothetical protein